MIVATLLILGTLLALGGFAYIFVSPKVYEARTRISVDLEDVTRRYEDWIRSRGGWPVEISISDEFALLQSKAVLHQVIRELALDQHWAVGGRQATPLTVEETYPLVRERVTVSFHHSTLLVITVWGYDTNEPVQIANKIVDIYRVVRAGQRLEMAAAFLNALKEKQAKDDQELESLAGSSTTPEITTKRAAAQQRRAALQNLIDFETATLSRPEKNAVIIIERAVPSSRPVRPNVFVGTTVLMAGGTIDLLVLLWVMMRVGGF